MYGLTTIKGQITRGLAAVALAALILLSASPASAQARGNTYRGLTTVAATSAPGRTVTFTYVVTNPGLVGMVWGQTMRLNFALLDGSVKPVKAQVRVSINGTTVLTRNHEPNPTSRFHSLDISRAERPVAGEPGTGRVQLWIEVVIIPRPAGRGRAGVSVLPPTFEVMDNLSGRTTASGGIWKTTNFLTTDSLGGRPISFTGLE